MVNFLQDAGALSESFVNDPLQRSRPAQPGNPTALVFTDPGGGRVRFAWGRF
jgi:hypothetical protein